MNRILFGVLIFISYLPLSFLYRISDFFYLILITLFPYRKKVIETNLKNSFPNFNTQEIKSLRNKFYRHFADLTIEGVKNLTISKQELKKRFIFKNPQIVEEFIKQNQSVMLISGHYGNWEWMITSLAIQFDCSVIGIGMPLTSSFWDVALNKRRSRFGLKVVHAGNYKSEFQDSKAKIFLVLSDQSPSNSENSYWTTFLNQPTAVLFGAEFMAHEHNLLPIFFELHKRKRGTYEVELKRFELQIHECDYGKITEWHTKHLENLIHSKPEFWLWSHKRWKREIPSDLISLKQSQQKRFSDRFKNPVNRN